MEDWVTLVGYGAAFFYVGLPLILWMNRGSRIDPVRIETISDNVSLPALASSHFWKTAAFFSSNGFEKVGHRVHESNANGFVAYKQIWHHNETGETAIAGTTLRNGNKPFSRTYVSFIHDLGDGAALVTSNFILPARHQFDTPGSSHLAVPFEDLEELRALHQGHVAAVPARARPLRVIDGLTFARELEASGRAAAMSRGLFRKQGDALRLTLKGAFVAVWINIPPLKWVYARRDRHLFEQAQAAASGSPALRSSSQAA